jgi:hypothetical protein
MSCINCLNLKTRVLDYNGIIGYFDQVPHSVMTRMQKGQAIRVVRCAQGMWDKDYIFDQKLDYWKIQYRIKRSNQEDCECFDDVNK